MGERFAEWGKMRAPTPVDQDRFYLWLATVPEKEEVIDDTEEEAVIQKRLNLPAVNCSE